MFIPSATSSSASYHDSSPSFHPVQGDDEEDGHSSTRRTLFSTEAEQHGSADESPLSIHFLSAGDERDEGDGELNDEEELPEYPDEEPEEEVDIPSLPATCSPTPLERDLCRIARVSVSSHKPGFGVEELLAPSTDRYWQSDGPQPHSIRVQFPRRVAVSRLAIFVAYGLDESYTPSRFAIRLGTGPATLLDLGDEGGVEVDLELGDGWMSVDLAGEGVPLYANMVQIVVLANHLNGKDTHMRGIKLFGPKPLPGMPGISGRPIVSSDGMRNDDTFKTHNVSENEDDDDHALLPFGLEFKSHSTLR